MSSSLYLTLTQEELKDLIARSLHTTIRSASLLTGGLFNTTYYVDTENCGPVVLRVGPVNRHLLMPFEHNLMEAEQHVYALCREKEIPVSEVLLCDTSKQILDRDYMIVRYIPSHPMSEVKLSPDSRSRICRDIGYVTANMHSIEASHFGRIVDVKHGKGFSKWSDCLINELKLWESVARPTGLFSASQHTQIEQIFERAVPVLDEIQTPKLVHTDLWQGNILIRSDTDDPKLAAIIDADRAMWGDPDIDFSSIQWTYEEPAFWEGYGRTLKEDASSVIRRSLYTLLWYLLDAYVYDSEYNEPENAAARKTGALEQIEKLEHLLGIL